MTTHRDFYDFLVRLVPNVNGRTYIRAYKSEWVEYEDQNGNKKKRSEQKFQHQVGVLEADNRVKMGKKFLEKFPLLANRVWYFLNNQLVDEATYFAEVRQAESDNPHRPLRIGYVLFEGFETLDLMGPVEMWNFVPNVEGHFVSQHGGLITSAQHFRTETIPWQVGRYDIVLVPGGPGTRTLVNDGDYLNALSTLLEATPQVLTVCTGSALVAKTGLLDGHRATSNKRAWDWVMAQSDRVHWEPSARWVADRKFVSSSGVSAGMDMTLAVIAQLTDLATAEAIAARTEYQWNRDPENDPFAVNKVD